LTLGGASDIIRLVTTKRTLRIGFLLFFILFVVSINFFHTEKTLNDRKPCPACQFQNTISSGEIASVDICVSLVSLEIILQPKTGLTRSVSCDLISPRSPPAA
jgi:hypothetical protein